MNPIVYKVYFTPRDGRRSYGTEIDISKYVLLDGIPAIKKTIDATDFDFGVYKYDDVTLKCVNLDGYFNDEQDSRSLFLYGRDKTKVRIVFSNDSGDEIVFKGFINEEATKIDPDDDLIDFRVLSLTSCLRTTKVSGGSINSGNLVSDAMYAILNVPDITDYLTVSAININPSNDFAVDTDDDLQNATVRDVLNRLLLASNSIMTINTSDEIIIRSRDEIDTNPVLNLYGANNIHGKCNILKLNNYNSGRHRTFTAVKINDSESGLSGYQQDYGYRQKRITLSFITDSVKEDSIADNLVDEFKYPKIELEVEVPKYVANGYDLLDRVSIDYPLRIKPIEDKFLPIIGITEIGDAMYPLPYEFGSLSIPPHVAFKIIEMVENPRDFTVKMKLRQIGKDIDDGYFNIPESCILGYGRIDEAIICDGGTDCDKFLTSFVGAANIGCTLIGE